MAILNIKRMIKLFKDVSGKGFFHLLSANLIIGFLAFGSQLLVAKFLAPVELGQIKVMQSFLGIATIFAGFGFNSAVLKLCSETRPLAEKEFILKRNIYYSAVPIIVTLLLILFLASLGVFSPDKTVNRLLPVYMLTVPAATYTALIIAYMQALKRIQLMAKIQVYIRLGGFVLVVIITRYYGMTGFILSAILIGYCALVPLILLSKKGLQSKTNMANVFANSFFLRNGALPQM